MSPADVGRRPPARKEITVDLYRLARIRSPGQYRSEPFVSLYSLKRVAATMRGRSVAASDALQGILTEAIKEINDSPYREAAVAIFGFDQTRWTTLGERQAHAASKFGVRHDAYRRRPSGGLSRYDETVAELAISLERLNHPSSPAHRRRPTVQAFPALYTARLVTSRPDYDTRTGKCRFAVELPAAAYSELEALALAEGVLVGELIRRLLLRQDSSRSARLTPRKALTHLPVAAER